MAPPDRSRRRRHGKSPRNKRFGSGKSTPSSPAGTPIRHQHTRKSELDEGASSSEPCLETRVESLSESSSAPREEPNKSLPLEGMSSASTSGTGKQSSASQKKVNEDSKSPLNVEKRKNRTLSGDMNKLDRLSSLLEHMVIEHNDFVPQKVHGTGSPRKEQKAQDDQKVAVPQTSNNDVSKSDQEKTREEIELERKLRKEAKKSKKKGSNKENENDPKENVKPPKESQKIQKPPPVSEGQQTKPAADAKDNVEDESGKSKADLKRERREKQEAQRKAKIEAKSQQEAEQKQKQPQGGNTKDKMAVLQPKKKEVEGKRGRDKKSADKECSERRFPLLGHLTSNSSQPPSHPINCDFIHPSVRTLGIKMKDRIIDGATARVVSMLAAFKRVISDYQTPESCDLSRDLAEKLLPNVAFLHACRPQNIAMDNAIRFLKHRVNSIEPSVPEAQAKDKLRAEIDDYILENIVLASSTIASHSAQVVKDGDVILTFGYSALVVDVVEAAFGRGEKVSVVVADTPHPASGASMAKKLADLGVKTYYRLITEISHIMNKVTKVIVEAEAVMMNGAVQGLCGTAGLALAASNHDTPFIVLCHTYKFCNNDLTDSLVLNELGDTDGMVSCPSSEYFNLLLDWRETPNLNVVNLVYDITPANLVTALVTEQNVLPTSAVPVIIRRNYADILGQD